jgi:hypothetical protein
VETRPLTNAERERLVPALQQVALAKKGLVGFLFGGKKAAAKSVEGEQVVTVVGLDIVGARMLCKATPQPGGRAAMVLALDEGRLLLVASPVLPTTAGNAFPHASMTWAIGPERALLEYTGTDQVLPRHMLKPASVSAVADRVLQGSWDLVDGHVFPGTLATCVADLERYVAALPSTPETVPVPGDADALPDEDEATDDDGD